MTSTLAFLTLCSVLLLANAQQNCNTPCETDPCEEGAICPRFLNANCEVDSCNCPRFMFRRRDVTNRCGESCDTRECGTFRECMEEVDSNPPGCTGQVRCRQRLRTKCVRIPRPMTCEDVNCGEGMMCRMRERRNRPPVVRCVPALTTTEPPTTTQQTTTTTPTVQTTTAFSTPATTRSPFTTPQPTTSIPVTLPPGPLCNGAECFPGTECIDFPQDGSISGFSGPSCFTIVRLDCENLTCPSDQDCVIQSIPSADISLTGCIPTSALEGFIPSTCENTTCEGDDSGCFESSHPSFNTSAICLPNFNETIKLGQFLQQQLLDQPSTTALPLTTTAFPFTSPLTTGTVTDGQTTTSSPTTLCNGAECFPGTECIDFPSGVVDGLNGLTCLPIFRLNCETLSCPLNEECVIQSSPDGVTLANCLSVQTLDTFTPSTCENITCDGDTACFTSIHPSFGIAALCVSSRFVSFFQFLRNRLLGQPSTTAIPTTASNTASSTTAFPFTSPLTTGTVTDGQTTTSSSTTLCNGAECFPGTECIDFPQDGSISGFSGPSCFSIIRLDCENLTCPSDQDCIIQSIPSADISLTGCIPTNALEGFIPSTCENTTCEGDDSGCFESSHPSFNTSAICLPNFNETIKLGQFLQQQLLDQPSTTALPLTTTAFPFTSPLTTGTVTDGQTTTSSTTTLCNGAECFPGTECIDFPQDGSISGFSGPSCFSIFRLDCENLTCTSDQDCIIQSIPSADISLAVCVPVGALETIPPGTCDNITCDSNVTDSGCVSFTDSSLNSSAMCFPSLNRTIELVQFLEERLLDPMNTTATPFSTATPSSPFTGIFTTLGTTQPMPTQSPLCTDDCSSMGLQCVPFPLQTGSNGETTVVGICLPIIGVSCDDITCPEGQECIVQTFVERDLTVAQCVAAPDVTSTPQPIITCATGQCSPGNACVDLQIGETQLPATCIPLDCSTDAECDAIQPGDVCISIPPEFNIGISSACVPSSAGVEFGMQTCVEIGRECPSPLTCQEAYFGDIQVGTLCNASPQLPTCSNITCSEGEECVLTISSIGTQPACAVNSTIAFFEQVLEILGLIDTSTTTLPPTTPTELITTLSTVAPTTESSCPFDCSSFGQICNTSGSFPTCVLPSTCTDELIVFCDMTFQDCQVSNGVATCVQRTSCEQHVCPDSRFECFEIPFSVTGQNSTTIAQCTPPVGQTCEELSCDEFVGCLETELRDLTYAQCVINVPQFPSTCETLVCSEGMVCVDLQRGGLPAMGSCLTAGCADDPNVCDFGTSCNVIPPEFELAVDSVCVPTAVNPEVGMETCTESGRNCTGNREVCLEALIDDTLVGTSCSVFSSVQTSTCQNSLCPSGEECILARIEGSVPVQTCLPSATVDTIFPIITAALDAITQ